MSNVYKVVIILTSILCTGCSIIEESIEDSNVIESVPVQEEVELDLNRQEVVMTNVVDIQDEIDWDNMNASKESYTKSEFIIYNPSHMYFISDGCRDYNLRINLDTTDGFYFIDEYLDGENIYISHSDTNPTIYFVADTTEGDAFVEQLWTPGVEIISNTKSGAERTVTYKDNLGFYNYLLIIDGVGYLNAFTENEDYINDLCDALTIVMSP